MAGKPEGRTGPDPVPDEGSPAIPWTVLTAIYSMLGVALFLLASAAVAFVDRSLATRPTDLAGGVVSAMILAGLWIWLALASEAGCRGARIAGTALLGTSASFVGLSFLPAAWLGTPMNAFCLFVFAVAVTAAIALGTFGYLALPLATLIFAGGLITTSTILGIHAAGMNLVVDTIVLATSLVAVIALWHPASARHFSPPRSG